MWVIIEEVCLANFSDNLWIMLKKFHSSIETDSINIILVVTHTLQ